jgi:predicted PurR-regulated permease PerM
MSTKGDAVISISIRTIVQALLAIVLVLGLYYIRDLVYIVLTSIVLASFVESGVKKLTKRGIGRTLSVVVIYFCTLALGIFFLYLFIPVFLEQLAQFSIFIDKYLPASSAGQYEVSGMNLSSILSNLEILASNQGAGVVQAASMIFGGLFNFVLLVVISFYLSINKGGIENFLRIVTPEKQEAYVLDLWKRTEHKLGLWFQGQLLLGILVAVLIYLGLLIFGVQYSLLLAIAAGILELVPFGLVLAAIPAIASGFVTGGGTGALEVAALYLIVQQFESNLIQPLIVKKVVGISSLVVILSLLIGLKLAGFWGIMLAIPAAVVLMEFFDDIEKKKSGATA